MGLTLMPNPSTDQRLTGGALIAMMLVKIHGC